MLEINLYHHSHSLYQLPFIEAIESKSVLVICPSPIVTDEYRAKIQGFHPEVEVITIAKFINDKLKNLGIESSIKRKSELLQDTSVAWKKHFPNEPVENFLLAFEQLTELRSFSTDYQLVEQVFSNYRPQIAIALRTFWLLIDGLEFIDEQKAYGLVAESIRGLTGDDELSQETLVFAGFSHMAASQIDLLQALAIRQGVHIPFPAMAFEKAHTSDWIKWLSCPAVAMEEKEEGQKELKRVSFSKGRLGETLKQYSRENSIDHPDIFLGKKNPTFNELGEIPYQNLFFKTQAPLFEEKVEGVLNVLLDCVETIDDLKTAKVIEVIRDLLKMELERVPEEKDFLAMKVLNAFLVTLESWEELSDLNSQFTFFDFNIIKQVIHLNLPRISLIPLIRKKEMGRLRGLEALEAFEPGKESLFCVSSGHGPLKGGESDYPEEMLEFLNAIGPVRRREMDFQLTKSKLLEILPHKKTILFIERGIEERDEGWAEVLGEMEPIEKSISRESKRGRQTFDLNSLITTKKNPSHLSASRMQMYLDCPRKYYLNYIESFSPDVVLEETLRPNQLGELQHLVIEKYLEEFNDFNRDEHQKICHSLYYQYLEKHRLNPPVYRRHSYLQEIIYYSRNGIENLLKLKEEFDVRFRFEEKVLGENVAGQIDCIVEFPGGGILVLDFKRSKPSIPTAKDITEIKKIQLWFYINFGPFDTSKVLGFGYLNLADPADSTIYALDKEFQLKLKESGFCGDKSQKLFKGELEEGIDAFCDQFDTVKTSLENESEYLAKPLDSSACRYCPIENLCDKGRENGQT